MSILPNKKRYHVYVLSSLLIIVLTLAARAWGVDPVEVFIQGLEENNDARENVQKALSLPYGLVLKDRQGQYGLAGAVIPAMLPTKRAGRWNHTGFTRPGSGRPWRRPARTITGSLCILNRENPCALQTCQWASRDREAGSRRSDR